MRNFISGASPDERNESIYKKVLWIHAPDFSRGGVIGDIQNVTNRETDYHKLWESLDTLEEQYENIAIQPVHDTLIKHNDLFKESYESLDEAEKE